MYNYNLSGSTFRNTTQLENSGNGSRMLSETDRAVIDKRNELFKNFLKSDDLPMIEKLLKYGVVIINNDHFSIKWAAKNGKMEILKRLLDYQQEFPVNHAKALFLARREGHREIENLLFETSSWTVDKKIDLTPPLLHLSKRHNHLRDYLEDKNKEKS